MCVLTEHGFDVLLRTHFALGALSTCVCAGYRSCGLGLLTGTHFLPLWALRHNRFRLINRRAKLLFSKTE